MVSQETKAQLAVTTKRLREAREEGDQIRADLKTMIMQYQVIGLWVWMLRPDC